MTEHPTGLQVLVAGTRPEEGEAVTAAHVRAALGTMKRQFSAIFVDCGSSFDEPTIAALEMADRIVVVCTPELNTLRDVRECQRVFGEIIRLDPKKLALVFNYNQPFAVLGREQFEATLEQTMLLELPHAGEAAYKAASKGEPLVLGNGGSAYSKAVEKLVRMLVPAEPKTQKRTVSLLKGQSPRQQGGLLSSFRGKRAS
jgi:pilus assembly protein CpaE